MEETSCPMGSSAALLLLLTKSLKSKEFSSSQEYRDHIRDTEPGGHHVTHVCPMHCGAAFSADTCLQHHVVRCFARQRLGPFSVVSCRDEMGNNIGE